MNRIDIRFIPGEEQRYDTLGDWWFAEDCLHIRATGDEPEAFLIALHELAVILCTVSASNPCSPSVSENSATNAASSSFPM